jgi:hypothetical protein
MKIEECNSVQQFLLLYVLCIVAWNKGMYSDRMNNDSNRYTLVSSHEINFSTENVFIDVYSLQFWTQLVRRSSVPCGSSTCAQVSST